MSIEDLKQREKELIEKFNINRAEGKRLDNDLKTVRKMIGDLARMFPDKTKQPQKP